MTLLAKTYKQLARDQRDRLVAAEFYAYRKAFPEASVATIVRTMVQSKKFDLSEPGIKRVLYATGAVTKTPRA